MPFAGLFAQKSSLPAIQEHSEVEVSQQSPSSGKVVNGGKSAKFKQYVARVLTSSSENTFTTHAEQQGACSAATVSSTSRVMRAIKSDGSQVNRLEAHKDNLFGKVALRCEMLRNSMADLSGSFPYRALSPQQSRQMKDGIVRQTEELNALIQQYIDGALDHLSIVFDEPERWKIFKNDLINLNSLIEDYDDLEKVTSGISLYRRDVAGLQKRISLSFFCKHVQSSWLTQHLIKCLEPMKHILYKHGFSMGPLEFQVELTGQLYLQFSFHHRENGNVSVVALPVGTEGRENLLSEMYIRFGAAMMVQWWQQFSRDNIVTFNLDLSELEKEGAPRLTFNVLQETLQAGNKIKWFFTFDIQNTCDLYEPQQDMVDIKPINWLRCFDRMDMLMLEQRLKSCQGALSSHQQVSKKIRFEPFWGEEKNLIRPDGQFIAGGHTRKQPLPSFAELVSSRLGIREANIL
ncbi:hypothetical protein [Endozoicomonas atrinae]|uniref:hypothetical protein n=1 Tax=Endozoicomonas atrinae TaxID=1333660 RepID=UPI000A484187|nr:hypothetical protein [Endozoicomonas atrinae]